LRDEIGCGIVFVTHDLGVAAQISDRITVMYQGQLVEEGTVREIFECPRHPYTRRLLRSRIDLDTPRDRPLTRPVPAAPASSPEDAAGAAADQDLPERWPDPVAGDESAIRLRGVERTFRSGPFWARRELHAVRGVDLDIALGESVALVGESGCGKSTLLRIVAGLQPATAGTTEVLGSTPQMVFQDAGSSLTPWLTVGDMLDERLVAHTSRRSRTQRRVAVAEVLARVGLPPEAAEARGDQLSGGQRQRVAIARAVIVPPRVLLCDEPTSALDVQLAATVLDLLGRLRRELGMSILFVTHDLAAARIIADRIAVMRAGRIIELGSTEQVCTAPTQDYTRALLDAIPGLRHRKPTPGSATTVTAGGFR